MSVRVLMVSWDLRHQGGVVAFVDALMRSFRSAEVRHLAVGRAPGSVRSDWRTLVADPVRLLRAVRAHDIDVVQLNPSFTASAVGRDAVLAATARVLGCKLLVFLHGWEPDFERRVWESRFWRRTARALVCDADHVVVLAPAFRDALIRLGVDPERVEVRTTLFDGRIFEGVTPTPGHAVTALFLSRVLREKGVFELVDALHLLRDAHPKLRLCIAGDGPDLNALRAHVAGRGLSERVVLPGFVTGSAKAQWLVDSDVFVLPTRYGEGCPISLLEAMAAGLPVVTTPVAGIPGVVMDGVHGLLLSDVDAASVARALDALLKDPETRARMAAINRETAWARYEAVHYAAELEQRYEQLVAETASARRAGRGGR